MTGKIALIERGVCEFGFKVLQAQNAGAIGALIYNNAGGGDALQAMGGGAGGGPAPIPSVFMRRTDGLNMVAYYTATPATAQAEFFHNPHAGPNPGDVIASFSSRGPTQEKTIKPDVTAPGVDVLSSGYGTGPFPGPFTGFGSASGTRRAGPHAGARRRAPAAAPPVVDAGDGQVGADDDGHRGRVLDHGTHDQGRRPRTRRGSHRPRAGRESAGQSKTSTVNARNIGGSADTWDISTIETGTAAQTANFNITAGKTSL